MKKRKIKKALKRIANLPMGMGLVRYASNKINHIIKRTSKSTIVAYPATIMLEVTNRCNLKCITCPREYGYGDQMDIGHMDLNLLKKIVDEAGPYLDSIGLTGLGEPLLYKELPQALQYIKQKNKGIITHISTNASLPYTIEKIKEIKNTIDTIQISIDGIGETYNKVRINGNYDLFLDNIKGIKQLVNPSTDITLNMVVIKENYHQMTDLIALTNELEFNNISFTLFNLASVTVYDKDYYEFFQSPIFIEQLNKALAEAKKYPNIDVSFWDYKTKNGFNKCSFPWSHFYISWDGYLTPCCAKPFPKELNFGNLNTTSFIDCLNNSEFQIFRTLWQKNSTPPFCKKCHFIDLKPISNL